MLAGIAAAAVALGVTQLLAVAFGPQADARTAIGSAIIDLTPGPVKEWTIQTFGTADKLFLTIVVLGVIAFACLMLYRFTKERTHSSFLHQLTWLLAASQLGATVLVAAGYVLIGALIVLLAIFALVALGLLLLDHR
jgi:hypothetical protein